MAIHHPTLADTEHRSPEVDTLASTYRLIADCFVYPEDLNHTQFIEDARGETLPLLEVHIDEEAAHLLDVFLDDLAELDTEEYIQTLELSPECPLYVGHFEFDQPETCREIADADRNQYMVELNAIYGHFGFELDKELPDFLPAMIEFLWLTLADRDDELRDEFMAKLRSMLPGMIDQFEAVDTPYQKPLKALERVIRHDLDMTSGGEH